MECARRRGRPGDAADRRRHRRPRGCDGARVPRRLHHPPARADAAGGGRRQPAGAGPCPADTDRACSHRDDRPAVRRCRVRGGFLVHPAVQRHDSLGVRPHSDRAAPARDRPSSAAAKPSPRARCRCGFRYERRSPTRDCSATSPHARCPAWRRCATAHTDERCGYPLAAESSVSHRNPTTCGASSCWTTSATSPRRSPAAAACWTSTPTPKPSLTRLAPTRT